MCKDSMFGWTSEAKLFRATTAPPSTYGFITPEEKRLEVIIKIVNEYNQEIEDNQFIPRRRLTSEYDLSDSFKVQDKFREAEKVGWVVYAFPTMIEQSSTYNTPIWHSSPEYLGSVILRAITASIYEELTSQDIDPGSTEERNIDKEREENLRVYNQIKAELFAKHTGKYVVIAKGKLQGVGESFDDVKYVAMDANHRFIFKVEPTKEKVRGTLRWPMRKK